MTGKSVWHPRQREAAGACSACLRWGRVWRYHERTIAQEGGYTLVVASALCADCIALVIERTGDDDTGAPRRRA